MKEKALAVSNKLTVTIPKSATKNFRSESQPCKILIMFSSLNIPLSVCF